MVRTTIRLDVGTKNSTSGSRRATARTRRCGGRAIPSAAARAIGDTAIARDESPRGARLHPARRPYDLHPPAPTLVLKGMTNLILTATANDCDCDCDCTGGGCC